MPESRAVDILRRRRHSSFAVAVECGLQSLHRPNRRMNRSKHGVEVLKAFASARLMAIASVGGLVV